MRNFIALTLGKGRGAALLFVACLGLSSVAHAAGTLAGTPIKNTATATYNDSNGKPVVVDSNPVTITVDEILNVKVTAADPGQIVTAPNATNAVMAFTVTNTGNGKEAFKLNPTSIIGGDQFDPTVTSVFLDTNNSGAYEPIGDTQYIAGTNDPVINPDASIKVFVISTIPGTTVNSDLGQLNLTAQDALGTGAPGTIFAGKGNGGVDAVVGASGATSTDKNFYIVQAANVSFVKSAVIVDPFGGATPVPGATITYSLVAKVNGTGSLNGITITDAVPGNTTYQPGTMTLEGTALGDSAADGDAGFYTGSGISVALGSVPAGQTRTVTFKVKIN